MLLAFILGAGHHGFVTDVKTGWVYAWQQPSKQEALA
jgi:hypothetical protein